MRRRRISYYPDPRGSALKRAGLAIAAGLVLLVGVLWFDDGKPPSHQTTVADALAPLPAPQTVDEPAPIAEENTTPPELDGSEPPADESADSAPLPDGYYVQLGVFNAAGNARRLHDSVVALELPAHIQSRVVVGPFDSKREAEEARERLKDIEEGIVLPPQKAAPAKPKPRPKQRQRQRAK